MVIVNFHGPLIQKYGTNSINVNNVKSIYEILKNLGIVNSDRKTSAFAGYIILVNGKDWRLYNVELNEKDVIDIIPINHGG